MTWRMEQSNGERFGGDFFSSNGELISLGIDYIDALEMQTQRLIGQISDSGLIREAFSLSPRPLGECTRPSSAVIMRGQINTELHHSLFFLGHNPFSSHFQTQFLHNSSQKALRSHVRC